MSLVYGCKYAFIPQRFLAVINLLFSNIDMYY